MIALIDADSLVYIIAWQYREHLNLEVLHDVRESCDNFMDSILTTVQADQYLGVFSSSKNFRHDLYLYRPYKGKRPEKMACVAYWEAPIKEHFCTKWGFYKSPNLEADDVVATLAMILDQPSVICSPDKDLKQIPGYHFDYKNQSLSVETISKDTACMNLWTQVLTGDSTDNIAGIPGMGKVKVDKLFKDAAQTGELNDLSLYQVVKSMFHTYFDPYYGDQIFQQTLKTVMLIQPTHPLWEQYSVELSSLKTTYVKQRPNTQSEMEKCIFGVREE